MSTPTSGRVRSASIAPLEAVEGLEHEADRSYFVMPQGGVTDQLEAALVARLADDPEAFSSL